ncbi:hypothetical protein RRG08_040551 [Elysia crispata]|uniref:Uncharacterized protein n=1 Tax=Elysia crispata TaxID=231223 RepID=A0AAE0Z8D2_9GAST|nr:hypothetical protein RRG08_040551 [Elysia crispata]
MIHPTLTQSRSISPARPLSLFCPSHSLSHLPRPWLGTLTRHLETRGLGLYISLQHHESLPARCCRRRLWF